jgi:hypothetical protein
MINAFSVKHNNLIPNKKEKGGKLVIRCKYNFLTTELCSLCNIATRVSALEFPMAANSVSFGSSHHTKYRFLI